MSDITPRRPNRPLFWPDIVLDLQDLLGDLDTPIYIVGGAVRDAYLHRTVKDIDLATPGDSIKVARWIADRLRGDVFVLDAQRGVGRVLIETTNGRLIMDVARFRGDDLLNDLTDRDFTINAMAVDLMGDPGLLIDPLGGEQDLTVKLLRRCAPYSLADDPIRALRAVRQSVQFTMHIESETLRDIRAVLPYLTAASPERIRDEFFNLLALPNPWAALRVADTLGLLELIAPDVKRLREYHPDESRPVSGWQHTLAVIEKLVNILTAISPQRTDHTAASFGLGMMVMQLDRYRDRLQHHLTAVWPNERPHRSLLILAAMMHDVGKAINGKNEPGYEQISAGQTAALADQLRLSNAEKQRMMTIVQHHSRPLTEKILDNLALHRFWYALDAAGVDVCLLALAEYLSAPVLDHDGWLMLVEQVRVLLEAYYDRYDQLVKPAPILDGKRLIEGLNLQPGPIIGDLLTIIREGQAAGEIHTTEEAFQRARLYLRDTS